MLMSSVFIVEKIWTFYIPLPFENECMPGIIICDRLQ